jgi:hypothetical protein
LKAGLRKQEKGFPWQELGKEPIKIFPVRFFPIGALFQKTLQKFKFSAFP